MPETAYREIIDQPADVRTAVDALSHADLFRLRQIAKYYSHGTEMNEDDLVQSAVTHALAGDRTWPANIPFLKFLAGAIRSIASSKRKTRKRERATRNRSAEDNTLGRNQDTPPADEACIDSESKAAFKNKGEEILNLFAGDDQATMVLMGMMDGLNGADLCEATGLNENELATVRRRIRRKILKAYPKGWIV